MTNNENLPEKFLYDSNYTWVDIQGKTATLGVIKPAADKVKEFVFVKLPKEGQSLKKGDNYVSLEALKWSGHLASPLSGKVIEVNQKVFDQPSLINQDPYGKGWIAKLELTAPNEKEELLKSQDKSKQA